MKFERITVRRLPDGTLAKVFPFHVSLEGMEDSLLCRDDEDYDVAVKYLALTARRHNVIIIGYTIVSNHAHLVVLAVNEESARKFANASKQRISMWLSRKYSLKKTLRHRDVDVQYLDSDWYLRNAIAYDIRNLFDNGADNPAMYKWTSYRCYFCRGAIAGEGMIRLSSLSSREVESFMHTNEDCRDTMWILNGNYEIEPASFCDWEYAEAAFAHDMAFFLKTIGVVNSMEMKDKLELAHKRRLSDGEFYKTVNEMSVRWFNMGLPDLSLSQKARLIKYAYHSVRSSVPQIARCFGMDREHVSSLLKKK